MLNKEKLEFLSKQLHEYKYHYDEILKANELLTDILDELKEDFKKDDNVVAYHDSRIKTPNSYLNKILKHYGTNDELEYDKMHDIVAHRIVFLNLSDINEFVNLLVNCKKINIIEPIDKRDYIKNKKESGYRSHHIILEVPFVDNDGVEQRVKAEIQLRTILQDIFAREEHKLSYKGNGKISEKDKKALIDLSDELFFFDTSLDRMARPLKNTNKVNKKELEKVLKEFNKTADLYGIMYQDLNKMIQEFCDEYDKKADILHIESRIKSISSIHRKLIKKKLRFKSDDIVYGLKDVLGFKIVCTDIGTVKDFLNYFNKRIEESDKVKINEQSDHLDVAKPSGYRGYKINLDYCPRYVADKPITTEVLVRTMVQDAWALQQDARVYNKENCYENSNDYVVNEYALRGLSFPLHRVEMLIDDVKGHNVSNETNTNNLVKEVKEYEMNKKLKLIKKDEE